MNADSMRDLSLAALLIVMPVSAFAQTAPPVPKPFPGTTNPATSAPATATVPTPAAPEAAAQATTPTGVPVYPAAKFLESFDAGQGQQYQLYGVDAPFAEIVAYYKSVLKNGGRTLFQAPAMHQFDLGRFQEQTMAYPPSVVVKDYTWNGSAGYLHVVGTTETRYKTIIQIVPPPPGR
jgi:hypothetical protein